MESKGKVLQAMKEAGKPVRPGQVAEATGIDKKEGKIISPKQCFYSIPE